MFDKSLLLFSNSILKVSIVSPKNNFLKFKLLHIKLEIFFTLNSCCLLNKQLKMFN